MSVPDPRPACRSDFDYELPQRLIAQRPLTRRSASRLLCLDGDSGALEDRHFEDLLGRLRPGDLVVLNDTRVIPARLYAVKASGGRVEILIERLLDGARVLAHVRASKAPKPGTLLRLEDQTTVVTEAHQGDLFQLRFPGGRSVAEILEEIGHVPLPPYIDRPDRDEDRERYQTVYGWRPGAVAAPTAGLHFDQPMLRRLTEGGVNIGFVTLHVGAGTFQPMRADRLRDHKMHSESMEVGPKLCRQVDAARASEGRVIAVGTTVARALESAARDGALLPYVGETELFIYPGYRFSVVDALITNFHLPKSTLLMLVCAFAGYQPVMAAYRHAVAQEYRFFSYGDAMFATRRRHP